MALLERTRLTAPVEDLKLRNELLQLNQKLNLVIDRVNEMWSDKESVAGVRYFNTLTTAIPAGTLLTYEGGTLALADASAIATSAYFVVRDHVPRDAKFRGITSDGDIYVRTEGSDDIDPGEPLFLSTTAGTVTTTPPASPNVMQFVGWALGKEDLEIDDRVHAQILINPSLARSQ